MPLRLMTCFGRPSCLKSVASVLYVDNQLVSRVLGVWLGLLFAVASLAHDSSSEKLIKVTTEKDGEVTHFYVENLQTADVTVTFETKLTNLETSLPMPCTATFAGKQRTKAFSVWPKDRGENWSWAYTYFATFGSVEAQHDPNAVYVLPYAPGRSYRVTQGYNGKYSHYGANQYAVDWKMSVGTPVHAARGGIVVGVKSDSDVGGADDKYDSDANYIMIRHSDKTIGHYVHLQKGGSVVKLGQRVEAGELIGFSGNTGHSTGPHLHFSVFKASSGKQRLSIPVQFETADEVATTLKTGRSYVAAQKPGVYGLARNQQQAQAREVSEPTLSEAALAPAGKP